MIGYEGMSFDDIGRFRMRNVKRGLYRPAANIGKAPLKRNLKNILESEVKRLDEREITKAIEWLSGRGFSSEDL